MRRIFTLCLLLISISVGAQINTKPVQITENLPQNWTVYFENDKISIEYRFIQCEHNIGYDKEYVILKLTNKTSDVLLFSWQMDMFYNDECKTCLYPAEYTYTMEVAANSSEQGECDLETNYRLKIFSKFIEPNVRNKEVLTAFRLTQLKATPGSN